MNAYRYHLHRKPFIERARGELAELYRDLRRNDPRIARLVYARYLEAGRVFRTQADKLYAA